MKIHIVQKGDTLLKIAADYGVDLEKLIAFNPQISSPDMIMPGMKIKIPQETKPIQKEAAIQTDEKEQKEKRAEKHKESQSKEDTKQKILKNERPMGDAILLDERMKEPVKAHVPKTLEVQEERKPRLKMSPKTIHAATDEELSRLNKEHDYYHKQATKRQEQTSPRESHQEFYRGEYGYDPTNYYLHERNSSYPPYMMPRSYCPCCYRQYNEYTPAYRPIGCHYPYVPPYYYY